MMTFCLSSIQRPLPAPTTRSLRLVLAEVREYSDVYDIQISILRTGEVLFVPTMCPALGRRGDGADSGASSPALLMCRQGLKCVRPMSVAFDGQSSLPPRQGSCL